MRCVKLKRESIAVRNKEILCKKYSNYDMYILDCKFVIALVITKIKQIFFDIFSSRVFPFSFRCSFQFVLYSHDSNYSGFE